MDSKKLQMTEEMTNILKENGCSEVVWLFPEETDFYQPIVVAKK